MGSFVYKCVYEHVLLSTVVISISNFTLLLRLQLVDYLCISFIPYRYDIIKRHRQHSLMVFNTTKFCRLYMRV